MPIGLVHKAFSVIKIVVPNRQIGPEPENLGEHGGLPRRVSLQIVDDLIGASPPFGS